MGTIRALTTASPDRAPGSADGLTLAPNLHLPVSAVTQTFAILAKRGVGKTYTAAVLTEELLKAGLPVAVIDPVGVWWGLRSSADGKHPGLPVVIFGGEHGDVPLEETAGELLADLLVSEQLPAVLDLSLLRKGQATRFLTEFAERLYHRNRDPLHLIIDEADAFAPQRPQKGQERMLGAAEDLVRRGRARGLGVTLITQRPAVLNKNVLTQVEVLITLRIIAPQDHSAIDDWVRQHDAYGQRDELMASLASLPVGTAWFWSPGWLDLFQRVEIRQRETFDSSATPSVTSGRVTGPKAFAAVDLGRLRERIAATVERAEADDPRRLRQRIAELERKLATATARAGQPQPQPQPEPRVERVVERVEVPVLDEQLVARLEAAAAPLFGVAEGIQQASDAIGAALGRWQQPAAEPGPAAAVSPRPTSTPASASAPGPGPGKLGRAQRAILTVLAQHPEGRTKRQLALQTGYAVKGGGFGNALGALRSAQLVERGDQVRVTPAGIDALGGAWAPLPSGGHALVEHWARQLGKAEGLILRVLVAAWPGTLTKQEVADRTGYAADGGGFGNALGRLRTLELIEGYRDLRAADALSQPG